jgi:hypothetical protein
MDMLLKVNVYIHPIYSTKFFLSPAILQIIHKENSATADPLGESRAVVSEKTFSLAR